MQVSRGLDTEAIAGSRCLVSFARIFGEVFHDLARQKDSKILEGHLQHDHVHMMIAIPPKYSVSQVVGYIKGKSAIHIARAYLGQRKNHSGMSFWARGLFCVNSRY